MITKRFLAKEIERLSSEIDDLREELDYRSRHYNSQIEKLTNELIGRTPSRRRTKSTAATVRCSSEESLEDAIKFKEAHGWTKKRQWKNRSTGYYYASFYR